MTDRAMGNVQLLGGRAEALVAGSRLEGTQGIEGAADVVSRAGFMDTHVRNSNMYVSTTPLSTT